MVLVGIHNDNLKHLVQSFLKYVSLEILYIIDGVTYLNAPPGDGAVVVVTIRLTTLAIAICIQHFLKYMCRLTSVGCCCACEGLLTQEFKVEPYRPFIVKGRHDVGRHNPSPSRRYASGTDEGMVVLKCTKCMGSLGILCDRTSDWRPG